MYQAGLPSQKQVFDWMNSRLRNHSSSIERLEDLINGHAYLHIAKQSLAQHLNAIKLDIKLQEQTNHDNYVELSRLMQQKGLSFPFNMQKLAQPNLYEHFLLSIFLFQTFQQPKGTPKKTGLKVLPPRSAKSVLLQKGVNVQISVSDLQYLHSKRRMNDVKCSLNESHTPNIKLADIQQQLVSLSKVEVKNGQSAKHKIFLHLATNQQRTHERNFIGMPMDKAKQLEASYLNAYRIANTQRFFTFLRNLTVNFLRNKEYIPQQTAQHTKIVDEFAKKLAVNFRNFMDLFHRSGEDKKERQYIRNYCANYYRSIGFLHLIVKNFYQRTKNKLNIITYLKKIELLPLKKMTQQQFCQFPKEYINVQVEVDKALIPSECTEDQSTRQQANSFRESQSKTEEREVQFDFSKRQKPISPFKIEKESQMMMMSTHESYTQEYDQTANQSEELETGHSSFEPSKEISLTEPQYWTIHRITLIAFEIQFVKIKDPDYDEEDLTHRSITQHTKFVTGLTITHLSKWKKTAKPQQIGKTLIQSQEYPNLSRLFGKKQEKDEGLSRLAEFVRILLSLKHDAVRHEFAQIYDSIVAEVRSVTFAEVKGRRDRFAFVEGVTAKLRQIAAEIDDALRGMLSLDEGGENATSLIRTSVYCLLAERFAFHTNELWPVAFPSSKPKNNLAKVQNSS